MKIVSYANPTPEGIVLQFDKPERLSGTMKVKEVWVSWDRISEIMSRGLDYITEGGEGVVGWSPVPGRDYPIKPENAPPECSCVGKYHSNNCLYKPSTGGGE